MGDLDCGDCDCNCDGCGDCDCACDACACDCLETCCSGETNVVLCCCFFPSTNDTGRISQAANSNRGCSLCSCCCPSSRRDHAATLKKRRKKICFWSSCFGGRTKHQSPQSSMVSNNKMDGRYPVDEERNKYENDELNMHPTGYKMDGRWSRPRPMQYPNDDAQFRT